MTLTAEFPLVSIPLHGLPIAAAVVDLNGLIVASNYRFDRLCARVEATQPLRLADAVADQYRDDVNEALDTLRAFGDQPTRGCSIKALRANPPHLWLAIDLVRLESDAAVPYLACAHAIAHRRHDDILQRRHCE
jgi:hypothetical protein